MADTPSNDGKQKRKRQKADPAGVTDLFAAAGEKREMPESAVPSLKAIDGGAGKPSSVPSQEFFIPIHQFVRLTKREVQVVDHPAFQRLGNVFQLGHTYLVYRGATHRRHEHALGTLHVAQMIIDALKRNARVEDRDERDNQGPWRIDSRLNDEETSLFRLGALLHDIGHLPAGHTFEDELGLLTKHDSIDRLDLVLGRTHWDGFDTGKSLDSLIDELYQEDVDATGLGCSPSELLRALIATDYEDVRSEPVSGNENFRLSVGRDLIGNTICADLLDYLHRDSHHLGKHRQFDTRLIEYMEVRRRVPTDENEKPIEPRLVVYLRDGDRVRHDAVSAVLSLLESRYQLFEVALYHRTKLAAAAMLERAIAEIAEALGDEWLADLPEQLLDRSDFEMLSFLRDEATIAAEKRKGAGKSNLEAAAANLVAVRQRRLQKKFYQRFQDQFTRPDREKIQKLYGHEGKATTGLRGTAAQNRLRALRLLEEDFSLPPLSLGMYCPPPRMSTKVAGVSILRHDDVHTLAAEEKQDRRLTGGHLEAQEQRFENLWHVYFACDSEVLEKLGESAMRPLLIDAIDCFVFGLSYGPVTLEERARTIATALSATSGSAWHGRQVIEEVVVGERDAESWEGYPTGLPALKSLFTP